MAEIIQKFVPMQKNLTLLEKFVLYNYKMNNLSGISGIIIGMICFITSFSDKSNVSFSFLDYLCMFICIILILFSILLFFKIFAVRSFLICWVVLFLIVFIIFLRIVYELLFSFLYSLRTTEIRT